MVSSQHASLSKTPILSIIKSVFRQMTDTKARDAVELVILIEKLKRHLRKF